VYIKPSEIKVVKAIDLKIMHEEEKIESEFLKRPKLNPFKTPEYYFDTLEDRIMANTQYQDKKKTKSSRAIQYLKPVLGLAASFALVYLLVYFPITTFLIKDNAPISGIDSTETDWTEVYSVTLSNISENTLVDAIFSEESPPVTETNPDELLAYLSSGMNDIEIYSEIQN
jgi:hypothetical protein